MELNKLSVSFQERPCLNERWSTLDIQLYNASLTNPVSKPEPKSGKSKKDWVTSKQVFTDRTMTTSTVKDQARQTEISEYKQVLTINTILNVSCWFCISRLWSRNQCCQLCHWLLCSCTNDNIRWRSCHLLINYRWRDHCIPSSHFFCLINCRDDYRLMFFCGRSYKS